MNESRDNLRALVLSLAFHALCVAVVALGLFWTHTEKPMSVAGSVIEATLVTAPPFYATRSRPAREQTPQASSPEPQPSRAETPSQPKPQAPQARPDTRDTERAALLARQQADKAQKAEIERKRQEQILLTEQRKQEEIERRDRLRRQELERQRQLAEIRKQLEEAKRQKKIEAERLSQLQDQTKIAANLAQQVARETPPAQQLGNQGTDNSVLGRYQLAIQLAVQQNWLRPETARPGVRCSIEIVQIPGGEVIQASVITPCNADDLTRRSIEAAVLKAQPLPYRGFESVFQRQVRFNFRYDGE